MQTSDPLNKLVLSSEGYSVISQEEISTVCGYNLHVALSLPSFTTPLFHVQKANFLNSLSAPHLPFYGRHPREERLPCGCGRPSGWCAGWPEGSWTAAGHWWVLAGTAAEWPAPVQRSCFSPKAEDSRIITDPAKSTQNEPSTLCPPLPPN